MKITFKTSLALMAGALLLTACENCDSPTITQPTAQDTGWLIYSNATDTIRFVDADNKPVKFLRSSVYSSNVPGDGYSIDDKCIDKMDTQLGVAIKDVTKGAQSKMPSLATMIYKKPNDLKVQLLVEQLVSFEIDEQNPTYATKEINGKTYTNVYEKKFEGNDKDNKGKPKAIYFNKEKGFIRIEYYGGALMQLPN